MIDNRITLEEKWIIEKVREGEVKETHVTKYRCPSRLYSWKE
jgi:hypothetical protein